MQQSMSLEMHASKKINVRMLLIALYEAVVSVTRQSTSVIKVNVSYM